MTGALWDVDFLLFDVLLSEQRARSESGDLLEIGTLYGKSAIVLGLMAEKGERVIVNDLFDLSAEAETNRHENESSYSDVSKQAFLRNYHRFVSTPPAVVRAMSSDLSAHIAPSTLRFAHIDGGHLYETVSLDLANVANFLLPRGIVVVDDFRAIHTPGVAAAVWENVANSGLTPICISEQKFYGTWDNGTAEIYAAALEDWCKADGAPPSGVQHVHGHPVRIMRNPSPSDLRGRLVGWIPPQLARKVRPRTEPFLGKL